MGFMKKTIRNDQGKVNSVVCRENMEEVFLC